MTRVILTYPPHQTEPSLDTLLAAFAAYCTSPVQIEYGWHHPALRIPAAAALVEAACALFLPAHGIAWRTT